MWTNGVSAGSLIMWGAWTVTVFLILGGWAIEQPQYGQGAYLTGPLAGGLMVIRDNTKTRKAVRAMVSGEQLPDELAARRLHPSLR